LKEIFRPNCERESFTYAELTTELPAYQGTSPKAYREKARRKLRRTYENYQRYYRYFVVEKEKQEKARTRAERLQRAAERQEGETFVHYFARRVKRKLKRMWNA
jgi:hypothetical protein